MSNKFISKIKGSKPFSIMMGITAILTALVAFTDTVEKVSNKFDIWFNPEAPKTEVGVTAISAEPQTPIVTVIDPHETIDPETGITSVDGSSTSGLIDTLNSLNPIDAFAAYNSKHVTEITNFSDAIAINKNNLIMNLSVESFMKDSTLKPINKYHINKRKTLYEINPSYNYLEDLSKGRISSNRLSIYNFGLPLFDVKTVNNSDKSVFITKAVFKIKKSVSDITPYFKNTGGDGFRIPIQNIGYGPAVDAKLTLSIKDSTGVTKVHKIQLDSVKGYCKRCDVTDILKTYNVNTDLFKGNFDNFPTPTEEKLARGAFKSSTVTIDGVLKYKALNINKTYQNYSFKFSHHVLLKARMNVSHSMMMAMGPTAPAYDLVFELDKENYTKTINVSQVLAPNGFDRFLVELYAPKSSRHLFDLMIVYNDGQTLTFENIALNYFKPRGVN